MGKKNTKDVILLEALKLFADRGYDGVTVRDIAAKVGIQQSSLYKHYTSKEDILNSIFIDMKNHYLNMTNSIQFAATNDFSKLANEYQTIGMEGLKKVCKTIFLYWLTDEKGSLFRRLLILEQFKHSEAEKLLKEFLLDGALLFQTQLFTEMIQNGYFKDSNPEILALEFHSPIYVLLCKYDGHPERREEALELLMKFIDDFDCNHRKGDVNVM